jgi:hypothetical protein
VHEASYVYLQKYVWSGGRSIVVNNGNI